MDMETLTRQAVETGNDPPTTTPPTISDDVLRLCRERLRGGEPTYVPVEEEPMSALNECFSTVRRRIRTHGGSIEYGWTIWEWPGIIVEAEHHAIWLTPDGRRVDIARKRYGEKNVLFVPDPKTPHVGKRVDNRRLAISKHQAVREFLAVTDEINREKGMSIGMFRMTSKLQALMFRMGELELKLRGMTSRALVEHARELAKTMRMGQS